MVLPLIAAADSQNEVHLFVGTGSNVSTTTNHRVCSLIIKRIHRVLNAGACAVVVNPSHQSHVEALETEFTSRVTILNRAVGTDDLTTLGRGITSGIVDRLFVNLPSSHPQEEILSLHDKCVRLRIPINIYQQQSLSTFHLTPTYTDPEGSGLQISVTTNGKGYILDERIKRDVINHLPSNISQVIMNMGNLRDEIVASHSKKTLGFGLDNDPWDSHTFNNFVSEDHDSKRHVRSRWLSQIMEYYPLSKLDTIQLADLKNLDWNLDSSREVTPIAQQGRISLVGSGPGSISMLTIGALHELKSADVILSDKLVPQTILDLIPSNTTLIIAKKFPGNAEHAQNEFLSLGLDYLTQGKHVLRLKQGDPYIFGRGGEEYQFFKAHGYTPIVLPGLSSSLSSTVVADIPATQRGVADQVLICTGTGKKGAVPQIPEYVETRTTVFLMALHRSNILQENLLNNKWDPELPVAIVERASCPDQRVTRTKLKYLSEVVEEIGSRPPGLIVTGHAVTQLVDDYEGIYHIDEGFNDINIDVSKIGL